MRKFFGSVFALTLTAALVVGLAFAWTGTASAPAAYSTTGAVSVSLYIDGYTGNLLFPGLNVKTAWGRVTNNTPVNVAITGGTISGINVPSNTGCNPYVDGSVGDINGASIAPSVTGGGWGSYLFLHSDTPQSCQSRGVDYTINVDVTT